MSFSQALLENIFLFHGCLHFTFRRKKYLYGLSHSLFEDQSIINRLNGELSNNNSSDPKVKDMKDEKNSQREKEKSNNYNQKSKVAQTRQKNLLKIDYIILPSKGCFHGYLWHFQHLSLLKCKSFLIFDQALKVYPKKLMSQITAQSKIIPQLYQSVESHIKQRLKIEIIYNSKQLTTKAQVQKKTKYQKQEQKKLSLQEQKIKIQQTNNLSQNQQMTIIINNNENSTMTYGQGQKGKNSSIIKQQQALHQNQNKPLIQQIQAINSNNSSEAIDLDIEIDDVNIEQVLQKVILKKFETQTKQKYHKLLINYQNLVQFNESQKNQLQNQNQKSLIKLSKESLQHLNENLYFPTFYYEMLIFTPENTQTLFCLNRSSILIIDPFEMSSRFLQILNIPLYAVNTIVLTKFSMNFMDFIINIYPYSDKKSQVYLNILTLDSIWQKIQETLQSKFSLNPQLIESRISFKIIKTKKNKKINQNLIQQKIQKYTLQNYKISYQQGIQQFWTFQFGQKAFKIISSELRVAPNQKDFNKVQLIFLTKIQQSVKKELKELPNFLQRKLVHLTHCYKHKYFYELSYEKPLIRITSQIFKDKKVSTNIKDRFLTMPFDERIYTQMKLHHGDQINCYNRKIILLDGVGVAVYQNCKKMILYNNFTTIQGNFSPFQQFAHDNLKSFISVKYSAILIEDKKISKSFNIHINNNFESIHSKIESKKQQFPIKQLKIFKISKNLIIQTISRFRTNFRHSIKDLSQNHDLQIISSQNLNLKQKTQNENQPIFMSEDLQVEIGSPLFLFDKIFQQKTYESGAIINQKNQSVYFVVKGMMKFKRKNQQKIGLNNYFMGCLSPSFRQSYSSSSFSNKLQAQKPSTNFVIQVIKDSWLLETSRKQFSLFMRKFPEIYDIFLWKGELFIN